MNLQRILSLYISTTTSQGWDKLTERFYEKSAKSKEYFMAYCEKYVSLLQQQALSVYLFFSQLSTAFIVFNPQCLASKPGITAGKQHGNSRAGTSVSLFLTNWLGFSSVAVCTDWLLDQAALGPYSLETPHSRNPVSLSVLAVRLQMHESLHRVTSKPFRVH